MNKIKKPMKKLGKGEEMQEWGKKNVGQQL
jgi:hypothetical protein